MTIFLIDEKFVQQTRGWLVSFQVCDQIFTKVFYFLEIHKLIFLKIVNEKFV